MIFLETTDPVPLTSAPFAAASQEDPASCRSFLYLHTLLLLLSSFLLSFLATTRSSKQSPTLPAEGDSFASYESTC